MARKQAKFYTVWEGYQPGVYKTWDDCQKQISGFSNARYRSFPTLAEAERAFKDHAETHWGTASRSQAGTPSPLTLEQLKAMGVALDSICVDAACKGNPGPLEYQGVELSTNVNLFHQGPYAEGTVNIGEFLAIVHALALLKPARPDQTVYSDSQTGIGWVKRGRCNTRLPRTPANDKLFGLVERAETWLAENEITNPILKWETKVWGEIPADFGRK